MFSLSCLSFVVLGALQLFLSSKYSFFPVILTLLIHTVLWRIFNSTLLPQIFTIPAPLTIVMLPLYLIRTQVPFPYNLIREAVHIFKYFLLHLNIWFIVELLILLLLLSLSPLNGSKGEFHPKVCKLQHRKTSNMKNQRYITH
jgi:hypothetical protein